MKTKTILAFLLLVIMGCGQHKNDQDKLKKLPFSLLFQGNLMAIDNESKEIVTITSQKHFEGWIKSLNFNEKDKLLTKKVDFSKYQILVVFDVIRYYFPSSINVVEIHKYENYILVQTKSELKGLAPAINRGFCIIQIPKITQNITVKKGIL
ncbi:hypothetical protein [Capnocytophaga cynodegmi]|uniref:hypothetical protein n=1 Tax=Capnocytophaga cynodegmi TaxID=28189 RepID=UPI00385BDE17